MPVIGYCNSPLNNKNIDYHCPVVFSHTRSPCKSLCSLCDCCCVLFILGCFFCFLLESFFVYASIA
jgi:hypothetical protein